MLQSMKLMTKIKTRIYYLGSPAGETFVQEMMTICSRDKAYPGIRCEAKQVDSAPYGSSGRGKPR